LRRAPCSYRSPSLVEPELAVALPAAGALIGAALRPRPRAALIVGAVLGVAGLAALVLAAPGLSSDQLGLRLSISAMSRALLLAGGGSLALVVAFAPARADRIVLLTWGLAGLAGMAAIAAAPTLDLVILVTLGIALLHAALAGGRSRSHFLGLG
jgi:hypothetical protein